MPGWHAMHGVAGSLSVSAVPGRQVAQVVWLEDEKEPLGQVLQGVEGSASRSALPDGQPSHASGVAKLPVPHVEHAVVES